MIHSYKLGGLNIVLDVFSGAVHVVDDIAYDIINMYESAPREEIIRTMREKYADRDNVTEEDIRECLDDIDALRDEGRLFTPDTFADKADVLKKRSEGIVKALCLHVAHTCNLNCSYCFASQGLSLIHI